MTRQSQALDAQSIEARQSLDKERQALLEAQAQLEARERAIAESEAAAVAGQESLDELRSQLEARSQEVRTVSVQTGTHTHKNDCQTHVCVCAVCTIVTTSKGIYVAAISEPGQGGVCEGAWCMCAGVSA